MKKFFNKFICLVVAFAVAFSICGCSPKNDENSSSISSSGVASNSSSLAVTTLPVPQVIVSFNGEAVWKRDENALFYVYKIDGGEEKLTDETKVQLQDKQTIEVKAVSGSDRYTDSEFSKPLKYEKNNTVGDHEHIDADDDGICNVCGANVLAKLSFFAMNDLHGKYMDTSSQPGVDEFTTYIKKLYADEERGEVLLSSGDMWQGTVESSSNKGKLMTEWMNEVGFSSMTLGNHEYDWGADNIASISSQANFPLLAINVTQNGKSVDYCKPSVVVERQGIKIGIIGAIGNCLSSISGDYTDGLSFAYGSKLTSLVKQESTRLRQEEDCDFIVYSIHDGFEGSYGSSITEVADYEISGYYDKSLSNGYVDLVFEGHTHQNYILKDEYGVYHLQGGGENSYVSSADVNYNTATEKFTVTPRLISNKVYGDSKIEDDAVVNQIYKKYFTENDPYTTVLGYNDYIKGDSDICPKLAQLYYEFGQKTWGNKYEIVLGGGFMKLRSPYRIDSGNVTYSQIFSIFPFDNAFVVGKIKGNYLKSRFLTANSNYYTYSPLDSSGVIDNQDYYIITDSYTSTYRSNHITEVERYNQDFYARDLLAEYVSQGGWN